MEICRKEIVIKKHEKILLSFLCLGGILIFTTLCFNENVWADEATTIVWMRQDLSQAFRDILNDVHPPLYYLMLKFVIWVFGEKLFFMKLLSVCAGAGILWLGRTKVCRLFGPVTAAFFMLLVICMPHMAEHFIQVRMYAWAMFFVTFTGLKAYEVLNEGRKRDWLFFWLGGICAAYTHYFALISVAVIYAFSFAALMMKQRQKVKWLFVCAGADIIAYLPWLTVLLSQVRKVSDGFWIATMSLRNILGAIGYVFNTGNIFVSLLLAGAIAIVFVYYLIKNFRGDKGKGILSLALIGVYVGTALIGILVSLLFRPVFMARYLIPSAGLLFLGISIGLSSCPRIWRRGVAVCVFLAGLVVYQGVWQEEYGIDSMETVTELHEIIPAGNKTFCDSDTGYWCLRYYMPDYINYPYYTDVDFMENLDDCWVFLQYDETKGKLEEKGYQLQEVGNVQFEDSNLILYRIDRK